MKCSPFLFAFIFGVFLLFSACKSDKKPSEQITVDSSPKSTVPLTPTERGWDITGATFRTLSGQLQKALAEGGVPEAIQYCNLAAYPIVDSLSKVHNAHIRRTSLKIRNPKNDPTELEQEILQKYQQLQSEGVALDVMIRERPDHNTFFFAPIRTNALCLQCHGIPGKTLSMENLATIHSFYPGDAAIGYVEGDLRGIWSIELLE